MLKKLGQIYHPACRPQQPYVSVTNFIIFRQFLTTIFCDFGYLLFQTYNYFYKFLKHFKLCWTSSAIVYWAIFMQIATHFSTRKLLCAYLFTHKLFCSCISYTNSSIKEAVGKILNQLIEREGWYPYVLCNFLMLFSFMFVLIY